MLIVEWSHITDTEEIPPMGDELRYHLGNRNGPVKHASCSAWILLHQTLLANGLPVGNVAFTANGKPYFSESHIFFSISHSHGVCAVAIADHPVGVDVERIRTNYPPNMIERSLTDTERAIYDGGFTCLWSRKEAVAKMTGEGIIGYPRNIDTTTYTFDEKQIEWNGHKYWLIAVSD